MRTQDDLGSRLASAHARELLSQFDISASTEVISDHPALAWRRAGLMVVTGKPSGPGLVAPAALTAAADGALAALKQIAPGVFPNSGALLLGERARLLGLTRKGAISPNGSCRLLETRLGRIALNLPRIEDWELIPALIGEPATDWPTLEHIAAKHSATELLAQGRLLGLAIAPDQPMASKPPFRITRFVNPQPASGPPLVVDLSALWAGPLAGSLLASAGARVIKVESTTRPDGARAGNPVFFDLLNHDKEHIHFDFKNPREIAELHALIGKADIIIESARPRALAALGINAAREAGRGATWISITAYGRENEQANWIGFGDDAAVAGGLSAAMQRYWCEKLIAGDAIADPLTGITAAFAAWASWLAGGGRLISLALAEVTANAIALHSPSPAEFNCWQSLAEQDSAPLYPVR